MPPERSLWKRLRGKLQRLESAGGHRAGSLALFDVSDLPELRHIFGTAAAHHVVARTVAALAALDPVHGRVLRTTPTSFAVVLPTYDVEQAHALVRRALGRSFAIEIEWRDEEIIVVPDFLVRPLGGENGLFDVVHSQMLEEIIAAQQHEKRRLRQLRANGESYCPASRARHRQATAKERVAPC